MQIRFRVEGLGSMIDMGLRVGGPGPKPDTLSPNGWATSYKLQNYGSLFLRRQPKIPKP